MRAMVVSDRSVWLDTTDLKKVNGVGESVQRTISAQSKEVSKLIRAENPPLFGVLQPDAMKKGVPVSWLDIENTTTQEVL